MRNDTKGKKLMGAALSALVMGGVILLSAGLFLAIVAGIAAAFFQRRKEIQRGEEEEARKY